MVARKAAKPHVRNAAATRESILGAARARFARESYENVGLREIAADAGVDAALIARYFGGKEELFAEVLGSVKRDESMFSGDINAFGRRAAARLIDDPPNSEKLATLMLLLRSISSPTAIEIVRRSGREHMFEPFIAWIGGGPDAPLRAHLACGVMMGMSVSRALNDDLAQSENEKRMLRARLAEVLQLCIAPMRTTRKAAAPRRNS